MPHVTFTSLTSSCFLSGAVLTLGMCVLEGAADFGPFLRGLPPPGLQGKRLYNMGLQAVLCSTIRGAGATRSQQIESVGSCRFRASACYNKCIKYVNCPKFSPQASLKSNYSVFLLWVNFCYSFKYQGCSKTLNSQSKRSKKCNGNR